MKERDIQRLFGQYLKEKGFKVPAVFELKIEKKKSMPFNRVADHQIKGLLQARDGLYLKIADQTIGRGGGFGATLPKPFDCAYFKEMTGFVAVCFYIPRKTKILYLIEVSDFVILRDRCGRKSLTEEMAKEHSCMLVVL